MEDSKCGSVPMQEKPDLSKAQGEKTPSEVNLNFSKILVKLTGLMLKAYRRGGEYGLLNFFKVSKTSSLKEPSGVMIYLAMKIISRWIERERDTTIYIGSVWGVYTIPTRYQIPIGYVFMLNVGFMDWKSAKQSTIAMYSVEAEYIAAAEASMEVVWMRRKFIDGHGNVMPTNKRPMEMLCDNIAAIAIANDPGIMKGAKHY
ncbi:hypothetical protein Tco_0889309 [Tanacetum coccineum]